MRRIRFRSLLPPIPKIGRLACLGVIAAGSMCTHDSVVVGESLWARRDQRSAFLFVDTRARRVGDLLIVRINEVTAIAEEDERSLRKQTATSGDFSFTGESASNGVSREASASFNANNNSNRSLQGQTEFESDRSFSDQLTATVVDIMPNRNLVIEGTRTRIISGEKRVMRVSGIVRRTTSNWATSCSRTQSPTSESPTMEKDRSWTTPITVPWESHHQTVAVLMLALKISNDCCFASNRIEPCSA